MSLLRESDKREIVRRVTGRGRSAVNEIFTTYIDQTPNGAKIFYNRIWAKIDAYETGFIYDYFGNDLIDLKEVQGEWSILYGIKHWSAVAKTNRDIIPNFIKAARNSGVPLSVLSCMEGATVTNADGRSISKDLYQYIGRNNNKTYFALGVFFENLHRESLVPGRYSGVDNIVALFNNGYVASNYVRGIWKGHNNNKPIRSKIGRETLGFMQEGLRMATNDVNADRKHKTASIILNPIYSADGKISVFSKESYSAKRVFEEMDAAGMSVADFEYARLQQEKKIRFNH